MEWIEELVRLSNKTSLLALDAMLQTMRIRCPYKSKFIYGIGISDTLILAERNLLKCLNSKNFLESSTLHSYQRNDKNSEMPFVIGVVTTDASCIKGIKFDKSSKWFLY